jgi:hypothetical protein
MRIGLRIPSLAKRIAARTSFKRFVRHGLGVKAARGLGWVTNPKRALYNRIYSRTTRGCMIYLIILLTGLVWLLVGCEFKPKKERAGKPTYISPSVDSMGRVRKGYARINREVEIFQHPQSLIFLKLIRCIFIADIKLKARNIHKGFFKWG